MSEKSQPSVLDPSIRVKCGKKTLILIRKSGGVAAFLLVDENGKMIAERFKYRYIRTTNEFEKLWKYIESHLKG